LARHIVVVPGVEHIIAQELIKGSVELVGAGVRNGIDDGTVASTELRGIGACLNLELLK
jgi:hypothetical protein